MSTTNPTPDAPVVGRLLSLNVGGPRDVPWEGKTVRTAIWKQPVDGRRMVRRINIDGDDQADRAAHGGEHRAVFVYQIESYRYWERQLQRDGFVYGQFGENFTVEGLADDEVCIGDRYQIGNAIFEVTQPRVTCFRVGIRLSEPRMPSLLVAHHRPGFYFRVIQEGEVEAGDDIRHLQTGPEELTVADVDGLLYLPNRSRRTLERALRIPALSKGWQGSFRELLEQAEHSAAAPPAPAWEGFAPLTVEAVHRESNTIVSFGLRPADTKEAVRAAAGQYLTVRLRPDGPDHAPVVRTYSMSAITPDDGYRISVKLEPGGAGSAFLQQHVKPGDVIEAAAPRGEFVLRDNDHPVALVSAGVGATPVLAMLRTLAKRHPARQVWWIHGARNGQEHAFRQEVDQLLAELPNGHRTTAYSRPGADDVLGATFDRAGRITIDTIEAMQIPEGADYYICGPAGFMRELSAGLTARGIPPERISMEIFGTVEASAPGVVGDRPAPHQPAGRPGQGPVVTFSRSNLAVAWDPSYSSLLEFAEACDVPVSFGCRTGVCHYCESGLVDGEVTYKTEPLEPPEEGRVLVCCTEPAGEVTLAL
ncbi:MAG TPA: MOSC and FAD-binding oxidoreductase domain-containing protein [Solirubrobacteraceae bacterium]|nr:MOSC and FAD-binding oxidoreductase domain-containing protein [Solirubrobacteraceae bacterium]